MAAGLRRAGPATVAATLVAVVAGCAAGPVGTAVSPAGPTSEPGRATGPEVEAARATLEGALGGLGLLLDDPQVPHRPGESPQLAGAPRAVFQAILPDDPTHGFISVYAFPDARTAEAAAREQAAYVASGPGRVQFPPDTRFVIRLLGRTVVFYAWSPANAADARAPDIEAALQSVGTAIEVPR